MDMADSKHAPPRGWSSFTKQRRYGINDEDRDPYPPLEPGSNLNSNSGANSNSYTADWRKLKEKIGTDEQNSQECKENSANSAHKELMEDALCVAGGGHSSIQEMDATSVGIAMEKLQIDGLSEYSTGVPVEPEYSGEDDDVYHKLRKDAIKISRLMSRHARAAANAYQRGDHHRARELSKEIQKEHALMEKLNAEAAQAILNMRNSDSKNMWRIDLHGLHTSEAVAVLQKKLLELEAYISASSRYSGDSRQFNKLGDSSTDLNDYDYKHDAPSSSSFQKPYSHSELTVITGVGAHSRNGPSLPNAVKSFLHANSYTFSEPRPGNIVVQLKRRSVLK